MDGTGVERELGRLAGELQAVASGIDHLRELQEDHMQRCHERQILAENRLTTVEGGLKQSRLIAGIIGTIMSGVLAALGLRQQQ